MIVGGNRTSPFISFWFLDLDPLISAKALLRWWQAVHGLIGETVKLMNRQDKYTANGHQGCTLLHTLMNQDLFADKSQTMEVCHLY